jgi:hypothetical protein
MSRDRRLRRRIKQIRNRHPHHWKNAVWAWANRGKKGNWRRKLRRFQAYRGYARDLERYLLDNMKPGHERKERRREMDRIVKAAGEKIEHLKKAHADHPDHPPTDADGIVLYDGKPVPAWMVPWLNEIRDEGWDGYVVSGVRTPQQSIGLCYAMCGAPSCTGRCAGAASNHNATPPVTYPEGALDVSDYIEFGYLARKVGSPLRNALGPRDPVHYSVSGN